MAARPGDRSLFPDLEATSYLAHCAISPVSAPVRAAVSRHLDAYARLGVRALGPALEERARLRGALAALIGARAEDLALVANTTTGVLSVAFGIRWRAGDRVVVFDGEFPANVFPWQQAAETFGLEIVRVPLAGFHAGDGLSELSRALAKGARLVAVSAVQFQTGLRMPVAEIAALCRGAGAELFVDAIQAVGAVPFDVGVGVDYCSFGSHKWLMGIEGCAGLYVAPERVGGLAPRLAGWLSYEDPVGFLLGPGPARYDRVPRGRADVFEGAAPNAAGLAALAAAVDVIGEVGVPAIHAHIQRWHDAIEPALVERGFRSLRAPWTEGRSGILSVRAPEGVDPQRLVTALGARGVTMSAPENCLRLAPSWPNALDEVPDVIAAIDRALEER